MSWKVCCGAKEGGKNVLFLQVSSRRRRGDYKKQKVCVRVCVRERERERKSEYVRGWERLGKIRNKKEEGGCRGPCTPLGLPCMLIRNTRFLPPEFIITGADSLGWPEAQHQRTYPTGCQHIGNLFLSSLSPSLLMFPSVHKRLSAPQARLFQRAELIPELPGIILSLPRSPTDRFRAQLLFVSCTERGDVSPWLMVPYLGSHGPLRFQLLLQLLDAGLKTEESKLKRISAEGLKENSLPFAKT